MKQTWIPTILIVGCLMLMGCQSESDRMADLAARTVEAQNAANEANAKAIEDATHLNRLVQMERNDIQQEKLSINQQFEKLETDRRRLHRQRRSELAWSKSFQFLAIVIAAGMPLLLCAYLLWIGSRPGTYQVEVNKILIDEFASPRPRLIRGPNLPAIEHQTDASN